jgi:VWFA-related protein
MKLSRRLHVLGVLVLALVVGQIVSSQQPTFRSGVNYVRVDVVVTDKDDKPLTDLTKGDFSIVDQGRPQAIDTFQLMSVPVEHRTMDASSSPPPPDVATNVAPTPNSRLFAIIVDDLHLVESDIIPLKRVLSDLIASMSPNDDIAIVFVGHSNLSVNFTRDLARLNRAVEHVREAMGFGLDALASQPNGSGTAASGSGLILTGSAGWRVNYARSAAFVLKNTATALAGSGHARRAIVYVSGGTTLKPYACAGNDPNCSREFADELADAYDAAHRADVPIYTIDPRGAVTPEDAVRGGIGVIHNPGIRSQIVANIKVQQDYLSEVAINTGGRAFTNMSDLSRAVREIVGENGSYYLLGYYPEPAVVDGKFHELKVHVNRSGVRVRAREGYVAPVPGHTATTAAIALDTAMKSGVNVSGLPIRVFAAPLATGANGVATAVTAEVSYPAPADGSRAIDDTLDFGVIAVDADGKIKAQSRRELKFSATAPLSGPLTFVIDDAIDLPSQPLTLRVGVASRALGTSGMIQVLLDVPKLAGSHLQMTGIVVGFGDDAAREPSMNASLIGRLVPFQPTTSRVFSAADTLRIYDHVFWGAKDGAASVTLTVSGAAATPPITTTLLASQTVNGRSEGTLDATVPLVSLPAGQYLLGVEARLPNGEAAHRLVPFEIR